MWLEKRNNADEHACRGYKLITAWEVINAKMQKCQGIGLVALVVPTR